ncbi:hypothetical protein TUM17558_33310 [Escherichia coli]|nr:hypothetical protein TUM17558_33310 [Escherichia coli]
MTCSKLDDSTINGSGHAATTVRLERGEDIRSMMKLLLKTWRIKQQEADQHS